MKLLIVIPALNEEESIRGIIERCIAAKEEITTHSPVTEVDITVVSDGSTDRTVERARQFGESIRLIIFQKNQGYGAAIKEAWRQSDADLLGFLDADGTCDPRFFTQLCSTLVREEAEMVLGSRLNKNSKMPRVRRFGNRLFSTFLSLLSSTRVSDTASGMRVVRRSSLWSLLPLPDGLHFTPAMSARAVLGKLRIREIDMPYHEREGESKLRIGKDGIRFLRAILEASFLYRPARPLFILSLVSFGCACVLMITPILYYLRYQAVQEWMIYRFVVSHLAGIIALMFLSAGYLSARVVQIALAEKGKMGRRFRAVAWFVRSPAFWLFPFALMTLGGLLVLPSFLELVHTGATFEHWSRFIAMSFFWSIAIILMGTRFLDYVLMLLEAQVIYLRETQSNKGEQK
jgi:glycosyltransferase involved in cell wall biosynthesis